MTTTICYIDLKRKKSRLLNVLFFIAGMLAFIVAISKDTSVPLLYCMSMLCIALSFTIRAKKTYLRLIVRDPGVIDIPIGNGNRKKAKKFIRKFDQYRDSNPQLLRSSETAQITLLQ